MPIIVIISSDASADGNTRIGEIEPVWTAVRVLAADAPWQPPPTYITLFYITLWYKRCEMSRTILTPSAYAVLGLLAREPSSGYELGSRAAASIDNFWPLTRTHIYGELAKLEALGYVVGVDVEQEHLPDKRVYSVTPQGAQALDAWLVDPDPGVPRPRQPMLVKLFFGERVAPEQAARLLTQYRAQALARRDRFAASAAADAAAVAVNPDSPRRFGRAAALFGLRRVEADLAWIDEVWGELRLPDLEGDVATDDSS